MRRRHGQEGSRRWRFRAGEWLRGGLLAIPALFVVGAVALSAAALSLGARFETFGSLLFTGGTSTAQTILSTIAGSTITLTGLVFSVTMLVLQLTSSRYSPRVLRTFLRDRTSKITLGVFVGTFTYCLAVLRTIDAAAGTRPGLAVSVAVLLALATVAVFVHYIDHIARKIRVNSIIDAVAGETDRAIDARFPESPGEQAPAPDRDLPAGAIIPARAKGLVLSAHVPEMLSTAKRAGCQVDLLVGIGRFVARGAPLFEVRPPGAVHDPPVNFERHLTLGSERTIDGDPAYGFRQLVDIAELSLSPSVNDPTTAAQVIDALHDLLRKLAARPFPTGHHYDDEGNLRVRLPEMTFEDYLDLAVDEILLHGAGSLQATTRLRAMLADVAVAARAERRQAVLGKLAQVETAQDVSFPPAG